MAVVIEVAGFLGAIVVAVIWYVDPYGNWEPLLAILMLVGIAMEMHRRIGRRAKSDRFASRGDRIQHREKLREQFRAEILECRVKNLRRGRNRAAH